MKILVSGANGQVGKCLKDVADSFPGVQFIFLGRENFALEQFEMVHNVLETLKPDWVVNTAAYTAVDKAENESALAFLINGEAVGNLVNACRQNDCRLLHISTDYVFDGQKHSPYVETDTVNPLGVYGASKLMGEELIEANAPDSVIVRTSWVYSSHGNNFVKTMLRLMKEKDSIGVVNDQYGCPTYAIDLAETLVQICLQQNPAAGIYHFSNTGPITWFDFASAIASITHSNCKVNAINTSQFPTLAKRPAYSVLSNEKLKSTFGIEQKDWLQSLEHCLQLLHGL